MSGIDSRGVSDTLGFVFVFALIVSSVGVVYTLGYGGLQDAQEAEQVVNAERAFEVLAANVDDVRRSGAPARTTQIRLSDAALRPGDPITVTVSGDYDTSVGASPEDFSTGPQEVVPVVYAAESGERLRYVNGAVIRSDANGGSVMLHEPSMLLDAPRVLVPLVLTSPETGGGIAGDTTATVHTERTDSSMPANGTVEGYDEVTIGVVTPFPGPWETYFTERGANCIQPGPETLECTLSDVEQAYVTQVRVSVSIE